MSTETSSTSPTEKKEDWIPLTPEESEKLSPVKNLVVSASSLDETTTADSEDSLPGGLVASSSTKDLKKEVHIIQELGRLVPSESTQDPFVQTILRGLDENVKKFQGAMDEHVMPHVGKARTVVDEHVGKHVQPHWDKAQENLRPHFDQVTKNWQTFSTSTRSLMDEKVVPGLEEFKKGTVVNFEQVKRGTVEGFETVKKGTVEGIETVKKGTVQGFETSKQVLIDLPANSKRAIDEHVLPAVETVKIGTKATIDTISTKSIESYQKHVLPHVEKANEVHTTYKSCYMGRALGLFAEDESRPHVILAEACLRSFGRVTFCDNPVTGGFILLAMLCGSPSTAFSSLASVLSLSYCAIYLGVISDDDLRTGSLGVNAVLVGAGASVFLTFENPFLGWFGSLILATFFLPPITLLVHLHCQGSAVFKGADGSPGIPILLIPYNIVMLAFLIAALFWDRSLVAVTATAEATAAIETNVLLGVFNGLSKIFLVEGAFSGLLILGGTLFCSRILAGSLLAGSIVATFLGWSFGMPAIMLNGGVAGYNAALTTAAMAYFFEPSLTLAVVGLFVVALSVFSQAAISLFFWETLYVPCNEWMRVDRKIFRLDSHILLFSSIFRGLPVTLTLGFCVATVAIMMMDTEQSCSRVGVVKRINDDELCTPEEFLANQSPLDGDDHDLILVDEEEGGGDGAGENPTESTPLISTKVGSINV